MKMYLYVSIEKHFISMWFKIHIVDVKVDQPCMSSLTHFVMMNMKYIAHYVYFILNKTLSIVYQKHQNIYSSLKYIV